MSSASASYPARLVATLVVVVVQALASHVVADDWTATHQPGGIKGIVELPGGVLISARFTRTPEQSAIIAVRSTDHGVTWTDEATVLVAPAGTDVGDGNLIVLRNNQVLLCYRYNQYSAQNPASYKIAVAQSGDGGLHWRPHSTVARSTEQNPRGLWAPFLFLTRTGQLLCLYDDEQTPQQDGLDHQQYVSIKRWDGAQQAWIDRRTVCRSHDPKDLSRDGMATVVELPDGRLLATVESIRRQSPRTNVIRVVTSSDGGNTWDWQTREPPVIYAPHDSAHLAVSPWLLALRTGRLACFFATDENQSQTVRPGTHPTRFHTDIKVVFSNDGRSWSSPSIVYGDGHRAYMPAAIETVDSDGRSIVLLQAWDFAKSPPRVQVTGHVDALK